MSIIGDREPIPKYPVPSPRPAANVGISFSTGITIALAFLLVFGVAGACLGVVASLVMAS